MAKDIGGTTAQELSSGSHPAWTARVANLCGVDSGVADDSEGLDYKWYVTSSIGTKTPAETSYVFFFFGYFVDTRLRI